MRKVLKFPLGIRPGLSQTVTMPWGAKVVHVHEQKDQPTLWVEADEIYFTNVKKHTFVVYATGQTIMGENDEYVGTVHIGWTVWHVYERTQT